ncbi:SAM-dependent methyltransferase [Actinocrispum sp. NPDC049592]|uniref:SAM-dependent methyltransferase n=1 Tax=Actinocrispum sp. NPDC049592 TaxID=3154835 RepID=UPI0034471314
MDMNKASITRVHDALLGGTENFAADRAVRDRLVAIDPEFPAAAKDVRAFLARAVRLLVREGRITQLLDCGLFLPIAYNSHVVAQQIVPDCAVVYPTIDPFILKEGQNQLARNDYAHVTDVNISHADRVLADPVVRAHLDFNRPMGLLHLVTLHHIPDHDDPWLTMERYIDALAPGSFAMIAHMLDPGPGSELSDTIGRIGQVYRAELGTGWPRSAERIRDLLPKLHWLEPGLVPVGDWRPEAPRTGPPGAMQRLILGGVAYKP